MRRLSAALAFCAALAAAAPARAWDTRVVTDYPGCRAPEDFFKLIRLMMSGDDLAAKRFTLAKIRAGDCMALAPGMPVYIERQPDGAGLMCVRPQGNPDCFWTHRAAFE